MAAPAQPPQPRSKRAAALGLIGSLALAGLASGGEALAQPNRPIPRVAASGGVMVQSQGGGTPNTVTGYLLAPLSQGAQGQVLFLDVAANMNLGGALYQGSNVSAGVSTRLGYRWLSGDQRWLYGFNAGVDTRQAYNNYAFQAGVGAEALSRNLELRVNGYIPFANQSDLYQSGYTNAYLRNNQLILDGWNRYVVSLGGTNLEAGIPVARWNNNSLWLYASYYYLDGDYVNGSSGVRGRGELRLGNQLAIGATVSYDAIFDTQATGYLRYGAKPLAGSARDAVDAAERNFLALRGLPMQRDVDLRMVSAQQDLPGSVATNPGNGGANWVVRCTGSTTTTGTANVSCANPTLDALLAAAGPGDVLLVGGGASSNLGGQTLRLAVGTSLTGSGSAPTLDTQFGAVNLNPVFGNAVGAQPAFTNGIISIGSNTTIAGFSFTNTSITNYSTSNVLIANNTFTGSYSPTPGLLTYNQDALPAIALTGVSNVTIANNSFSNPNIQSYLSARGEADGGGTEYVCGRDRPPFTLLQGICLSGNAIRVTNGSNYSILNNTISGALDEAIRLDNPNGIARVKGNMISGMRMGPDTNIGAAIFVRQNTGTSTIYVEDNTVIDNAPGRNLIQNTGGNSLASGSITPVVNATDRRFGNVIDGLEVGLCRGRLSFPRADDLYGDADILPQDCSPSAPPTMNFFALNNTIRPNATGALAGWFNYDGIDLNIGSYSTFNSSISGNNVEVNTRGNAFTSDFRGSTLANPSLANNAFTSGNAPIDILAQTIGIPTPFSTGTIAISGGSLSNQGGGELFDIATASNNNTQTIVPIYYVNAPDYTQAEASFSIPNFSSGIALPEVYFNGNKVLPTPP
jgi:hypothetical protein